jgi:hypothetical protein
MRYLFLLFTLLITVTTKYYSQWSTDPNNNLIIGYGLDPHICSNSAGGCYVTYDYDNLYYPRKMAVERIDKYGYKPWGIKKQILGELPQQWQAAIIEDGEGGLIVGYEDNEWIPPYYFKSRVRVQKVDSIGNFLWGSTGIRVSVQELNQGNIRIINDGNGGCIVVWNQELSDYTYEYRANRINQLGERTWSDSGIFIVNSLSSEPASIVKSIDGNYYVQYSNIYRLNQYGQILNQYYGNMLGQPVPDTEGGVIISGGANWSINGYTLIAQRKDSLGNNLWQEPYVEIADSLDINTLLNINYNNGYYYYSWTGKKNGIDKIAQFQALRLDGTKLFSEGSLPLSNYPIDALLGGILSSDSGSVVLIWEDFRPDDGVFAQKVDTSGKKLWDTTDVRLYSGAYADLFTTTDGNGGAIGLGWHQYDFSIRVFNVSKNGIMGEVVVPVELISFTANMINDKVELNWQTATELNNQVFQIERRKTQDEGIKEWENIGSINGSGTTTEPQSYTFIDENISAGIYQYRLKQMDYDGSFEYSNEIEVYVGIAPKEFVLEQNYPNPFNPSTTIKFQLPNDGMVTLKVYDILGNEVTTLINEQKPQGRYEVNFNASQLASGVYVYKLRAGDFISSKKMIHLK